MMQTSGEDIVDDNEYLMRMCSSQAMQFKTLFDVLKDLLTEVNLRFDEKGFKIVSLDPGKIGMIYLSIYDLEKYFCNEVIYAGSIINYLYRILRTVSTGHYLEWRIRKDQPRILEVVLSHHDRRIQTLHHVKILNLDIEEITIPVVEFDCVVSMPSTDLQKHIKELSHVSNVLTIRGNERNIQFIARGDLGDTCIDISPTPSGLNWIHRRETGQTFDGSYFIKYIERFSRGQVDSIVQLFFRQDYPLIMRYNMTIGSLRFCVAPIRDPGQVETSDVGGDGHVKALPVKTTNRPRTIIPKARTRKPPAFKARPTEPAPEPPERMEIEQLEE